jgi:hypothetical protein
MTPMRRSTLLILIAAGAAVVGFTIASAAERIRGSESEPVPSRPAPAQVAKLDWHEKIGSAGERLEFGWDRFQVVRGGWRAHISVTNDSQVAFELDKPNRSFGLMLFSSGKHQDLTERNSAGTLPAVRFGISYKPPLPDTLEPKETWEGTMSGPGALAAGSWVRIVFGYFDAVGAAPDIFKGSLLWITDHAYPLKR